MSRVIQAIILISLLINPICGFSRDYIIGEVDVKKVDGVYVITDKQHGELVNGVVKGYYESGVLEAEAPFKDGKREGIVKEYYESGALKFETPYKDGKKEGIGKQYFESGELKSEIPYTDNKINGIKKEYYRSGALLAEAPYKDDKKQGIEKKYYESGELGREITFVSGKAVSGVVYNKDGSVDYKMTNAHYHKMRMPY